MADTRLWLINAIWWGSLNLVFGLSVGRILSIIITVINDVKRLKKVTRIDIRSLQIRKERRFYNW